MEQCIVQGTRKVPIFPKDVVITCIRPKNAYQYQKSSLPFPAVPTVVVVDKSLFSSNLRPPITRKEGIVHSQLFQTAKENKSFFGSSCGNLV